MESLLWYVLGIFIVCFNLYNMNRNTWLLRLCAWDCLWSKKVMTVLARRLILDDDAVVYIIDYAVRYGHLDLLEIVYHSVIFNSVMINLAFQLAVDHKQVEIMQYLLKFQCVDLSYIKSDQLVGLVDLGRFDILKLLSDAKVDFGTADGCVIRHVLKKIQTKPDQWLLNQSITNIKHVNAETIRALVKNGTTEFVELLFSQARNKISYVNTYTIYYLIIYNKIDMMCVLLKNGIVPYPDMILDTIRCGTTQMLDFILTNSKADLTDACIVSACDIGRVKIVKRLLDDPRVNAGVESNKPIRLAAKKGFHKIVRMLLARSDVDPTVDDNYALRKACKLGREKVVMILLADPRVNPAVRSNYPIRLAARNRHINVVGLLMLNDKVNPSDCNNEAIRRTNWQIAKLLLRDDTVKLLVKKYPELYGLDIVRVAEK